MSGGEDERRAQSSARFYGEPVPQPQPETPTVWVASPRASDAVDAVDAVSAFDTPVGARTAQFDAPDRTAQFDVPGVTAIGLWRDGPAKPPARSRRKAGVGLLVALLVAVALVLGLSRLNQSTGVTVTGVTVTSSAPSGKSCDVTVDVVGTLATDGKAGMITYQWLRSGEQPGEVLQQSVAAGMRQVVVHLRWQFTGAGSYQATATLKVIQSSPVSGSGAVVYHCRG